MPNLRSRMQLDARVSQALNQVDVSELDGIQAKQVLTGT